MCAKFAYKLDGLCGWSEDGHSTPLQIPNLPSMTPLVMKLAIMETEIYHEFPIDSMPDASQANDSGYESYESASQATEDSFELAI